jgi:hypothetical protein
VEVTKRKRSLLLHKHTTWLPALMARGTEWVGTFYNYFIIDKV